MGVEVWIATMMMSSERMMLNVKSTSSIKGGTGSTNSIRISKMMTGITTELRGKFPMICRSFVNAVIVNSISY